MLDKETLDKLTQKLTALLPNDLYKQKEALQKSFRALLQSHFNELELVSRDEFDIQSNVLAKTRQKLEALEEQVLALSKEASVSGKPQAKEKE